MKKKLNNVLLIDDDDDCNFFHQRLLKDMQCAKNIVIATDGQEAIDILSTEVKAGEFLQPQIIFLDINMPVMDGWEFMEEYQMLAPEMKANIVLIMLTTSLNPDDKEKANQYEDIKGFQNKLLTKDKMLDVLEMHFSEFL